MSGPAGGTDVDDTTVEAAVPVVEPRRRAGRPTRRGNGARRLWSRRFRALIALAAAVFFFGPSVAGVLGVRAGELENRALTPLPEIIQGWGLFDQLNQWTIDHLPLRDQAVRFNTDLSQRVFGEVPAYGGERAAADRARVLPGRDGWLYLAADVSFMCSPLASVDHVLANGNRMAEVLEPTGATVIQAVPPDKATVETENLPDDYPDSDCGPPAKRAFWDAYNAAPPTGSVDVYGPIMDLRAREGEPIWRPTDSHWAPIAAAEYARALVTRLDPDLLESTELVDLGPTSSIGDLTRLLGTPAENQYENHVWRRPGVTVSAPVPGKVGSLDTMTYRAQTTDAPVYPGRVTIIGDSYTEYSLPQLAPFFAELTYVRMDATASHVPDLATLLADSDVIIVEAVERVYASGREPLYQDATLDALAEAVSGAVARR